MSGVIGNHGGGKFKPTALKVLQGTLRKHRENPAEPAYPDASLEPPTYLSAEERAHWHFIAPLLAKVRVLTEADRTALGRYCVLQQAFQSTKRNMKSDEFALDKLMKLNVQLKGIEVEFGLTPASRSRIHAQPVEKEDENAKKEKRFFS